MAREHPQRSLCKEPKCRPGSVCLTISLKRCKSLPPKEHISKCRNRRLCVRVDGRVTTARPRVHVNAVTCERTRAHKCMSLHITYWCLCMCERVIVNLQKENREDAVRNPWEARAFTLVPCPSPAQTTPPSLNGHSGPVHFGGIKWEHCLLRIKRGLGLFFLNHLCNNECRARAGATLARLSFQCFGPSL